jgi:hypothetical protein
MLNLKEYYFSLLTDKPFVGEFEGRRKAPQRGDWRSEPLVPGSGLTNKKPQPTSMYRLPTSLAL